MGVSPGNRRYVFRAGYLATFYRRPARRVGYLAANGAIPADQEITATLFKAPPYTREGLLRAGNYLSPSCSEFQRSIGENGTPSFTSSMNGLVVERGRLVFLSARLARWRRDCW